jgi:hypothetical protein
MEKSVRFTNVWLLEATAELVVGGAGLSRIGTAYDRRRVPPLLGGLAGALVLQRAFCGRVSGRSARSMRRRPISLR